MKDTVDLLYNLNDYMLELRYRLQKAQKDARQHLLKNKLQRKYNYDENINSIISYNKDDLILVKNETRNKLNEQYRESSIR